MVIDINFKKRRNQKCFDVAIIVIHLMIFHSCQWDFICVDSEVIKKKNVTKSSWLSGFYHLSVSLLKYSLSLRYGSCFILVAIRSWHHNSDI